MATEAGIISALIGTATATAVDGTVRNLQVGDKVFPNEIITTGLAGAIEIEFPDGSVMDLGRNSQAVLDSETFDFDVAAAETPAPATDVADDIDAIQQALLAGEDPTQIADPTAAGPGAQPTSEGGSEAVFVDYLAPRVTPDAGFETTGPGVDFLDPPPFEFLVDESDDLDVVDPVDPVDNTPPVADPVLTSYFFANESALALPENSFVYKQFSIGGGVDDLEYGNNQPSIFEFAPSLGGNDAETAEANLIFTLTKLPSFGDIYLEETDGTFVKLELNDTFEFGESIIWSADETQFIAHLNESPIITIGGTDENSWDSVVLIARDLEGNIADVAYDEGGIGVSGGTIVPGQLEHRNGDSESIEVKFSGPSTGAEISLSNLIGPEREVGQVQALLNGVVVGTWLFTSSYSSTVANADGTVSKIDFSLANGGYTAGIERGDGSFSLPDGVIFDSLIFTAKNYGIPGNINIADSSDYYIDNISVKTLPPADFEYNVTDEDGNSSESVVVGISSSATIISGDDGDNQIVGSDADNVIIGGSGDDILTGGAGKDIFVWNSGDEGISDSPANDTVTDFNISEGDVLDFSDILVGEEAGNLTDFISITEDGADIVIELKPDAGDVTQTVTLQGKSLADLGLGGFDTSTQQAEIINKLVQDGHVNVDS